MGLERVLGHIPARWENKPIAELSALRREKRDTQALGADLIVRALAILLVVVHHATLWPIPAGAAAMVVLIGYSLARFQSKADRKSVVAGKSVSVRVDLGGRRIIKKKKIGRKRSNT